MKRIHTDQIIQIVEEMCIEANYYLSSDMAKGIEESINNEKSQVGKKILHMLEENLKIAQNDQIPICQDTGMAVVFVELGQGVVIEGGSLDNSIHEGVRRGYEKGFLRKSVVSDPLIRKNTGDNTPAIIHYEVVEGDKLKITLAPKGFGSENMSRIYMLKPSDGVEGVKDVIIKTVDELGVNACPPLVIGVGLGGTFEKSALLAKKALLRPLDEFSNVEHIKDLEIELLEKINKLGIGPQGLGGTTTALALNIETYPTHIAGLPVAINICCHVNRHVSKVL